MDPHKSYARIRVGHLENLRINLHYMEIPGKEMRIRLLRMDDRGFEGRQQPAASDRDQICIHVTQMQKLKDPLLIKR